jgi:membrane-associated phospholipid phosphatase
MFRTVKYRIKKTWAALALLSVELVITLFFFFVSLMVFAWLVRRVFVLNKTQFDERAFEGLARYVSPQNNELMQAVTFLGTHYFLIPANLVLIGWYLFIRKHRWYSIKVPAIAISSLVLMLLLKALFARARPLVPLLEAARGFSFPSGHAFMSTTFYGLLAYIVWQDVKNTGLRLTLTVALVVLILFISFSRIYLRVHYTSDVIAGLCLGIVWLVISITTIKRIEQWSKRRVAPINDPVSEAVPASKES